MNRTLMAVKRLLGAAPVAAVLLVLCGCAAMAAGPPAKVPLDANRLDPGSQMRAAAPAPWPDSHWWRTYGDPELDRLVDGAIAGNPRLAAAASRIAAAQAMARVNGAALKPSIEAGAEFDRTRFTHDQIYPQQINGYHLFDEIWSNSAGVSLTQHLDFWHRDRAALEASLDEVKVDEYEAQDARLTLETAVIRAYAELSYAYEIRTHETAILAAEERTLDLAKRRLNAGLGTELEIEQAHNATAATEAQLVEVDERMVLLRHQLAALCGAGPGAGESIGQPALHWSQTPGLPATIPAELIGRRPDVLAARWRVEGAARQIDVAKAAFYPNVNLKATLGFVGFGFGQLLTDRALNASVGPAVTLPIFEGGRLQAGLDVRSAQYDAAVEAYDATVIQALREVSDQIERLASLDRLRTRREETLAFATRANELAQIAFRAGLTDYNNVLSTEDALNRALILIADLGLQRITAIAALNQALGGGLVGGGLTDGG
jgi:NodT family efflux transporter outer membrane factor (OMF) lipoprotein